MQSFEPTYNQFENRPVEAIKHLMQVRKGQAIKALYRSDIGFIDIVWGDDSFGLKHIIDKHGLEIKQLGFSVENFIPIVIAFGELKVSKREDRILLEGNMFRVVISETYKGKTKRFLLSAFDLRKSKKTFGTIGIIGGNNFTKYPLHISTNVSGDKDTVLI